MSLISLLPSFEEGELIYKWSDSRINHNKNVIIATTGPTGSGKSLNDLKKAEIIYRKRFNEDFPIKNCCFTISELMLRISSGELRKGEVLILEEAGVNAGSADWQNKVVKMFNYVLQSFRSMNIILFMNLPVLSMLSKQARQLVHMHMETTGIDFQNGKVSVKPLCHQLNQHSGKSYWKYMRVRYKGSVIVIHRMNFGLPSKELIEQYEQKKAKFLSDITKEFSDDLIKREKDKLDKLTRDDLKPVQRRRFNKVVFDGMNPQDIATEEGVSVRSVYKSLEECENKGYDWHVKNLKIKNDTQTDNPGV